MTKIVEIRNYTLKPGTRETFHSLMLEQSLPMLKQWNVDVVFCSASLHDQNSYCLIRAYDNLEHRQQSQYAFYGSSEWRLQQISK
jgi:NIPSNAP